jgi:hypothetical protein
MSGRGLRTALAAAVAAGVCAPAADAQQALNVFVTQSREVRKVRGEEKKALERELRPKINAAREAKKLTEKDLKEKHGKKKDEWPEAARDEYQRVEDEYAAAVAALEYVSVDPRETEDSAQDIRESLAGKGLAAVKKAVNIVSDVEQADLVVEVVGRRGEKTLPTQLRNDMYFVAVKISPGPGLDKRRMAQVPRKWTGSRFGGWVSKIHTATEEEPWITLEAYGEQRWSNAGNNAAGAVNKFIEDNYAVLKGK